MEVQKAGLLFCLFLFSVFLLDYTESTEDCMHHRGEDYRGKISITETGHTCEHWDSDPQNAFKPSTHPEKNLEENYCRNPDREPRPWCYSSNPSKRWEYCSIPQCQDCIHCTGEDYRGKISITETGHTCQRWDFNPQYVFKPSSHPDENLEENYCRNPDGSRKPWCYTTDPSKSWEFCSIPRCKTEPPTIVPEHTCITGKGRSYRGTISVTRSGKTCQKWTSQTPHEHIMVTGNYPCKGLEENYCRNPNNEKEPWCITTDPETLWEYCNVPRCEDQPESGGLKCGQPAIEPKLCSLRVVGGCVSEPHSWPWQISLRIGQQKSHWCGGTLIDPQWVLTAAHCFEDSPSDLYKIFLGTHTKQGNESSKQERDISNKFKRPSGADLALVKLNRPAEINDQVSLACLPEKDYIVPDETECFVTGWGATHRTGGEGYLKEAGIPILENKICNSPSYYNGLIKEHEMCAGLEEGGTDTCQGDSGGPLVCKAQNKFVLQGVTSHGDGCAKAMKPGVYVCVSKFIDWIEKNMKEN